MLLKAKTNKEKLKNLLNVDLKISIIIYFLKIPSTARNEPVSTCVNLNVIFMGAPEPNISASTRKPLIPSNRKPTHIGLNNKGINGFHETAVV